MNTTLSIIFMLFIAVACGHTKKDMKKDYSPVVSFKEEGKEFQAKVKLPKSFKEKVPLIIIVHEWWGRTPYIMERAEKLTQEGYAVLAVDLFGDGVVVETPKEAEALATPFYKNPQLGVKRLNKYIKLAIKDPHVDSHQIFVIGHCFGGTQALNLARSGSTVKGIVSFHGGLDSTLSGTNIQTKILVLNGGADPMVPAKDVAAFKKEMKRAKANYTFITYPGATHAFSNPKATQIGKKYNMPIAYDKKADEASWKELLKFLKE
jgi:dienelactone hydrolase